MDNMEIAGELAKVALEKGYMAHDEGDTATTTTVERRAQNTATFMEIVYKKLEELYEVATS